MGPRKCLPGGLSSGQSEDEPLAVRRRRLQKNALPGARQVALPYSPGLGEPLQALDLPLARSARDAPSRLQHFSREDEEPLAVRARRLRDARAGGALQRARDGKCASPSASHQGCWAELPAEVLSGILRAAAAEHGAVPSLPRIARVCRSWRDVVRTDASLWRKLDLARGGCRPSNRIFASNCNAGRWSQLEWLSVAGCSQLTDAALSHVACCCPRLTYLNLSDRCSFTAAGLLCVVHACPIQDLVMDRCNSLSVGDLKSKAFLEPWMFRTLCKAARQQVNVGHVLEAATFLGRCTLARVQARCSTMNTDAFVCGLTKLYPQAPLVALRVLDLTLTGMGRRDKLELVAIEALQLACPGLEELRWADVGDLQGWAMKDWDRASRERHMSLSGRAPGFEHLRALDLSASRKQSSQGESQMGASYLTDDHLKRIAGASTKLEELGLAGCRQLTPMALTLLPTQSIRFLQMSHCGAADDSALALAASVWQETLQEIDVGGNRCKITDVGVQTLSRCTALQRVGLTRTGVSESSLWALVPLTRCHLEEMDVAGCRNLERSTKAAGCGAKGLPALVRALEEWVQRQARVRA